tara:strand:+ start:329 stop:1231 length:903 start_codon:yes stop_codon:yes gene_type:complete
MVESTEEAIEDTTEEAEETEYTEDVSEDTDEDTDSGSDVDWRSSIQDADLRKHAERFTTPEALVKANLDYRKKEGKSVTRLSEDSSDKEVEAYREALGVPSDVDGYEFPLPEGHERSDAMMDSEDTWSNLFLNNNVPKETADVLVSAFREEIGKMQGLSAEADDKYAADATAALKSEWKEDYDKNLIFAARASEKLLGDDYESARFMEDKSGRYLLDNPIMAKMFATLGRQMGEGNLGSVVTDGERDTLMQKANDFRQKSKDAHAKGNTSDANKFAAKELEVLTVLNGSDPVVGTGGRQF